jgi:omega-6 fatty acid desaturase (delta-12 desaturase)
MTSTTRQQQHAAPTHLEEAQDRSNADPAHRPPDLHASGADAVFSAEGTTTATADKALGQALARQFAALGADWKRSLLQLVTTATPFLALLVVMVLAVDGYYWLTLLLSIPTAGLLLRLFIIQHDCGHGSFFRSRAANDWLGRILCVLTFTPYGNWKRAHDAHHATTGHLDRRGRGDIDTLTVAEYRALGRLGRLGYRLYRHPFVMVLLGAPIHFLLLQRLPIGRA